jgi:hypothetical protein
MAFYMKMCRSTLFFVSILMIFIHNKNIIGIPYIWFKYGYIIDMDILCCDVMSLCMIKIRIKNNKKKKKLKNYIYLNKEITNLLKRNLLLEMT